MFVISALGGSGVQNQFWGHSSFRASFGYMLHCLNRELEKMGKEERNVMNDTLPKQKSSALSRQ